MSDDKILSGVAATFLDIPNEYLPLSGMIGKKYEAVKDFCKWHGYKKRVFVPIFLKMGEAWARGVVKHGKNPSTND